MTREDFLYALENEGLIDIERDDHWNFMIEETLDSDDFRKWFWSSHWEKVSLWVVYRILEDEWAFDD